ncbi:uncharacterized protein LOC128233821 [Mya arenaria]|uniref:uncharacterized protein LOC128233821 n=1 Tax=Mya arenaria TaxID=6604 RepID=UPI0022E74525|nr:uncharacterized protein LOC128233821 [Mya arenaria]
MSIEEGRITSRATPTSKGEKTRYIRPVERQRMRPWLIEALEKDDVPGLTWQTRNQGIFRISWKHAANQCFHMQNDTNLFERWAIHTGRHDDSDHKRWKANFRCALNSLPDVMELKDHGVKKGSNAFKVYKFLDEKETKANRENKALAKIKKETTFTSVPDRHTYLKSSESGDEASSAVGGIPNLSCLVPASSDEMLVDAGGDDDAGSLDHLQEILTAATASLAEGIDASALEQISIEQLSRMGEVSKMKLDIRDSEQSEPSEPMYVYLCSWCKKVFPSRVELFQHFLVEHQERLLAREEYHQEGSNLQREIEDLEKKVFNFTREKFKSKDSGEVIEDGQVVDISTTHIMTSQDVYIEDQALDLTVTPAHVPTVIRQEVALDLSSGAIGKKHKFIVTASPSKGQTKVIAKKRRSGALDMDYIKKFDEFGMVGKAQTKRQLSLVTKKKEEKEKMKKSEGGKKDVDPASQHSMEDIAHAEILISLKSAANEDEETDDAEEDAGDTDEDSEKGEKTQAAKGVKRARADDDDEEDEDEDDAAKAFRCGICSNTFSDAATLYAHVTEHKNEYKCGICNEVYDDKDNYVQHLVTHVPSAELLQEANKSPPKEHKCNFCEKAFPSAKKLEKHKTEHYTIIAMKTKGDKVAMVVHPKQGNDEADTRVALIHQKQANDVPETKTNPAGEIEKEAVVKKKSVPVDGNQDVYIVYSSEGGDKVCEVVTAPSETSSEHEGMEVEKNADTDSVDGMQAKIELSKAGSKEINEGTNRKAVKEEKSQEQTKGNVCKDGQNGESQLPAFSEIVKDVDEFFIKETKPQLKKDVKEEPVGEDPEDEIESKGEETRNEEELMEIIITNREETVEEISEYEFKCIICKEEHDTQQKLNEHMKLHSIFELANAKGSIEGKEKTSTEGEKKSKVFICKLCGSNFNQFTDLKKHVASHLEKSKKREVKEGGLKETVPRAKRGRPPIRKVPGMKEGNETGRTATSKQKAKTDQAISEKLQGGTSILAAALKKGPKFQLSPALFEKNKGAVEKVDERGDAKPKISEIKKKLEAPPKPAIVSDTSEPEKESFVETKSSNSTEIVTEQNEVKVNDLKEKKEDESFASKLLVQGVTSYLQNKDGTITQEQKIEFVPTPIASMPMPAVVTQNISSITATNPPAKSPQAANIPVINPAVISNLVTMGNITSIGNQAINIAGKVAPVNQLGPVRIMTASDIKNAAPQQVIFLKQGTPLPVQLATQLSALQQSVMTAPQMPTLQQVSLPVTHFGGLQPTAISIPQLTQVQQTTISIPQQTAVPATVMQSAVPKTGATKPVWTQYGWKSQKSQAGTAPTVKQMISAQKSAAMKTGQGHKTPTVLPVSFVKSLGTATGNITIASVAPVSSPKPAVTIPPKITIPLSALQVLPAASVATNETTASTTVNPVIAEHTDANSKVNPQVQSNLLNMVLARMGQAGSNVSVITTAATSVAASISSTGPTITAVSSEAFKTAVGGKSLLTASVLAGSSDGKATGQFTKEELLQQAKSLQLKDGLFLFCSRCKQALTSLEEMSAHVCNANKVTSQTPSPLSGINLTNVPSTTSEPAQKVQKTLTTDDVAAARNSAPLKSGMTGTAVAASSLLTSQQSNVGYGKNSRCQHCVGDPVSVGFHQLIAHNNECKICYARLKKVEVYQHANIHCMNVMRNCIQCLTCKDIFVAMDLYNDHKDHCDKNAEYTTVNHPLVKCQGCSLHLKSTNIVLWHVKKSHIQRVWYSCSICDKTFQFWKDVKSSVMEHMQLENGGNPPDISFCHFCNLVFKDTTDRVAHEKTQEHTKNYFMKVKNLGTVIVSGKSQGIVFPTSADEHLRIADKPEAMNEIVDDICCRECSLRFKSLFQLRQHRVIRHGEVMKGRPKLPPVLNTCEACRKTFLVPYRLKKHQEVCHKYIQSKFGGASTNNKQSGVEIVTSKTSATEVCDDEERVETQDIENS